MNYKDKIYAFKGNQVPNKYLKAVQQLDETKLEPVYIPYTGGAGPSDDQIRNNNLALKKELEKLGYVVVVAWNRDLDGDVIQFKFRGKNVQVSYDHYGFMCDQRDDFGDQVSMTCTLRYFTPKAKK